MRFAINFLKSNVRIDSPALLSSPFLMISLGYAGHRLGYQLSPQQAADLRYWLLVANTKGRYSRGSSETLLDQDLNRLRNEKGIETLIETLRLQFGKLEIEPGELEGRNARSAYFKTMFLAFSQDGAKDWVSNLAISLSHKGKQHRLQFHHIFPRAILKGQFRPVVINDIANLSFIGGKTNRSISSKSPHIYFPKIVEKQGEKPFATQCIPTVDADDLRAGKQLLYFDAAYRISRAMAVAAVRKESANEIDLGQIENHIEALGTWSERINNFSTPEQQMPHDLATTNGQTAMMYAGTLLGMDLEPNWRNRRRLSKPLKR